MLYDPYAVAVAVVAAAVMRWCVSMTLCVTIKQLYHSFPLPRRTSKRIVASTKIFTSKTGPMTKTIFAYDSIDNAGSQYIALANVSLGVNRVDFFF